MIVMVQAGRLGNQIFQYVALRHTSRSRERVVLLGFDSLRNVFEGVDATFVSIDGNPLRHAQSLNYARWSPRIKAIPGLGTLSEDRDGTPRRSGRHVMDIVEPSWFQVTDATRAPALDPMRVRPQHIGRAYGAAHNAGVDLAEAAFVHVRAGDYRSWPSADAPAILSPEWYQARMSELRHAHPGIRFIALGDEPEYTARVVQGATDAVILNEDESTEFAAMTLCRAGIASASSFAFWGSYFAHRTHHGGMYLAPQYWAGHAQGSWYPRELDVSFLDYR